jgi:protein SCO1/2
MNDRPKRNVALIAAPFALLAAVVAFFVIAVVLRPGAGSATPRFHGTPWEPPAPAPAFTLMAHTGEVATMDDFRGHPVLLFFGYTQCPDVCPMTLSRLSRVIDAIGQKAEDVRIVLVTVDPDNDSPEALARYVAGFQGPVVGMTGDPEALASIWRAYGVHAEPVASDDSHHDVAHTEAIYGIDRAGRIRVLMQSDASEEELRADVRTLIGL